MGTKVPILGHFYRDSLMVRPLKGSKWPFTRAILSPFIGPVQRTGLKMVKFDHFGAGPLDRPYKMVILWSFFWSKWSKLIVLVFGPAYGPNSDRPQIGGAQGRLVWPNLFFKFKSALCTFRCLHLAPKAQKNVTGAKNKVIPTKMAHFCAPFFSPLWRCIWALELQGPDGLG